jgi:hypothetical protein
MPILASLGTANDRAFGFGDSSVYEYTVLPSVITENAEIIYDASNLDSYPGTGTTWFDLSGNDRHATLGGTPTIIGAGANQYFVFTDTNNAQVPSVFETPSTGGDVEFVYYFVANFTDVYAILSTAQWGVNRFTFNGKIYFSGFSGSGSGNIPSDYDPSGWRLFKVTVDASLTAGTYFFSDSKAVRTYIGGQTANTVSGISSNTGGDPTFSSFTAQDGAAIKFISLYSPANDPGLTNVYNALKGRFGL